MSKRYPGNFITGNPVALSQTSNNGIWDLKDNYASTSAGTWQETDGIYEIPRSLRFRRSATAYLTKVAGAPTSQNIWTISMWVKLGNMASNASTNGGFFSANQVGNPNESIKWGGMGEGNGAKIYYSSATSGGTNNITRFIDYAFRDPSAWYHLVFQKNGSAASGLQFFSAWVNGVAVLNYAGAYVGTQASVPDYINISGNTFNIGGIGGANTLDCHMAEVNFVDGQALDASYFGYTDSVNGIWQPKKYTGAYGNNGFYLPFNQYTSPRMLGKNSGNPSNLLTYSEQLDNGAWLKPAAAVAPVVTANAAFAPDGTTTADLVTFAGATTHPVYQEITIPSFTVGDTYTGSMYLKTSVAGTYNLQLVYFLTAGGNQDGYTTVTFNSSGVLTSFSSSNSYISSTAVHVGGGWYRVSVTSRWEIGGAGTTVRMSIGQGSGASSIFAWGAQINLGESPDAYVQTVASAVNQSFTVNNFSVTAGATNDSMVDSPTNVFTSATDIGGVVSGNYPTWNPIKITAANYTITDGALQASTGSSSNTIVWATMFLPSTGKWYWEITNVAGSGLMSAIGASPEFYFDGNNTSGTGFYRSNGQIQNVAGANQTSGNSYTNGDIIGIAVDVDAGTLQFYKNNVAQGATPSVTFTAGTVLIPFCAGDNTAGTKTFIANFGQRPFAYTPPTGFKTLNTTNLQALGSNTVGSAAIQPNKWFNTVLYGGTGAARTITNPGGFVPDLVWTKVRNTTYSHNLVDSARGAGFRSSTDTNAVESANVNGGVTSFNTTNNNGYNIDGGVEVNENGRPYVSWQWKASPIAGLNIVTYTGTGVLRSISHNLGVAPKMIMIKRRNVAGNWSVYHASLASVNHSMYMNSTGAQASDVNTRGSAPTSSSFSVGTDLDVNQITTNYVAYLFAEVPGFSKFGSYTGNGGADGTFVYTGFRPRFILIRAFSTGLRDWLMYDSARNTYNVISEGPLQPNLAGTPYGSGYYGIDFLSNGFKLRESTTNMNASGESHLYMCFAESPFALNNRAR